MISYLIEIVIEMNVDSDTMCGVGTFSGDSNVEVSGCIWGVDGMEREIEIG